MSIQLEFHSLNVSNAESHPVSIYGNDGEPSSYQWLSVHHNTSVALGFKYQLNSLFSIKI